MSNELHPPKQIPCNVCKKVYLFFPDSVHVCGSCKADAYDELVKALEDIAALRQRVIDKPNNATELCDIADAALAKARGEA